MFYVQPVSKAKAKPASKAKEKPVSKAKPASKKGAKVKKSEVVAESTGEGEDDDE